MGLTSSIMAATHPELQGHCVSHRLKCDTHIKSVTDITTNVQSLGESHMDRVMDTTPLTHSHSSTHIFSQPATHTSSPRLNTHTVTYPVTVTKAHKHRATKDGTTDTTPQPQPCTHSNIDKKYRVHAH